MIRYCVRGETGNIYYIMSMAAQELDGCGRDADVMRMYNRVIKCGSYEEALKVIGEYVCLEEVESDDLTCVES